MQNIAAFAAPCGHGMATRIDNYNHDHFCDDDSCALTAARLKLIAEANAKTLHPDLGFVFAMEDLRHAKLARRFNALLRGE